MKKYCRNSTSASHFFLTIRTHIALAVVGVMALATLCVRADNYVWNGLASPDDNWTTALNWTSNSVPPNPLPFTGFNNSDGSITFSGGSATMQSFVNSQWDIGRLVFDNTSGSYILNGSALVLEQGQAGNANYSIHHQGGTSTANMTINNNIIFTTNAGTANLRRQVVVDGAAGVLTFNGNITKSNAGLAEIYFRGNGTEILNGNLLWDTNRILKTDNSLLLLNSSGNVWTQLVLSVGTVRLGVDNALPVTSSVDYNQNATVSLDLSNHNQTIAFLRNSGTGGAQTLATGTNAGGTLTLNDNGVTNVVAVVISGNGRLVKAGTGTLILSGNSTYNGGTTVNGGILQIGNAGGGGNLAGNITNNTTLVHSRTDSSTLAGSISGTGSFFKLSSGTVLLPGALTYTGNTTISNGVMSVNGSLNNSTAVSVYGGTLGGTGTVGSATTVFAGGQFQPGGVLPNPPLPGTIVASNLTVNSGGVLAVKLGPTTTIDSGINDLLVADSLTLNAGSALSLIALGDLAPGGTYVIATYNSLSGTFTTVSNSTRYNLTVDYSVPNQIRVQVGGVNASLVWAGTNASWDLTTSNWLNGVARDRFYPGDAVTFDNTATNFSPSLTTTLLPATVTVNASSNYTFGGAGRISGTATISKSGTGQLTVNNANDFSGQVSINAGVLRAGNGSALGLTNGNTVVNGGTFDIGGQNLGFERLVVQGTGPNGTNGAINNAGGAQQSALRYVSLAGDATFNASANRWDIHNSGNSGAQVQGNGFKLTKRGGQDIWIKDVGDTGFGDIDIAQGTLGFQGAPMGLGDTTKTLTVLPGATLGLWDVRSNLLNKQLVLTNGNVFCGGGSNNLIGPVTLQGTNTLLTDVALHIWGPISGPGGFNKNNGSIVYLDGTNTYTGPTFINTGQLIVGLNSSINSSTLIQLGTSTVLDLLGSSQGLTLGAGQTLAGRGVVNGGVTNNGSTISAGSGGPGLLTISGDLMLNNATNAVELGSDPFQLGTGSDFISASGTLTLGGVNTIRIVPVAPLSTATPYSIMSYGAFLNGGSANLQVVSSNPRYTFSVIDPATTAPYIQIGVSGNPTPLIWKGGKLPNPIVWDHTVTNWLNSGTSQFDRFYDGDLVTFDDTAVTNLVQVTETNTVGLMTVSNNTANLTFTGSGALAGILTKQGTNTTTFNFTNANAYQLSWITNNAGTIVFNAISNTVLNTSIADENFIGGSIVKQGAANLAIANTADNSLFNGPITVANGSLIVNGDFNLGSTAGLTTVSNGARLYLIGNRSISESLTLNGVFDGVGGALQAGGSATVNQNGALTLGPGTNRISVDSGSTLNMAGGIVASTGDLVVDTLGNASFANAPVDGLGTHSLTKVGTGQLTMAADSTLFDGPVFVNAGILRVSGTTLIHALGSSVGSTIVRTNTTLDFFFNSPTLDEPITINGFGTANQGAIHLGGGAGCNPVLLGPVTVGSDAQIKLDGSTTLVVSNNIAGNASLLVTIDGNGPFRVEGNLQLGSGSLIKNSGGQLVLNGGANNWTGNTFLVSGSIALGPTATFGSSSQIIIGTNSGSGAVLEAAASSVSLGNGQTLGGYGTVRGTATLNSGATFSAGFGGMGTLTVTNSVTFNSGSTNRVEYSKSGSVTNDALSSSGTIQIGGTLVLSNSSVSSLVGGDSLKLFNAPTITGAFAAIEPPTPGSGLQWDTSTLLADGTLRVVSVAVPQISTVTVSGGNVVLTGSGGTPSTGFTVMTHTNLTAPLAIWTTNGTGTFDGSGNFSYGTPVTPGIPQQFYLIRVP